MGFLLGLPAPRVRYAFASCPYSIRRRPISWAARDGVTSLDLALYLVTDRQATRGRTLEHVVEAALRGGVSIVQLREKQASTREMVSIGNKLRALTRQFGVPLLVNDRIDVAQAIAADGVHLGQDDMPADLARRILGPEAIIGVSAGNIEEAKLAMECGAADYLGVGPVYLTKTKSDAGDAIGMMGLSQVIRDANIPVVAIGGITTETANQCHLAGAAGIAVISAIISAEDPEQAARSCLRNFQGTFRS